MNHITTFITQYQKEFETLLNNSNKIDEIDVIHAQFLGKNGVISSLNELLKQSSIEEKRIIGPTIQALRNEIEQTLKQKRTELLNRIALESIEKNRFFDVSLIKNKNTSYGSLHPITLIQNEIEDIFVSLGFSIVHGPELETDFYNFEALNINKDHPARDSHDTFWLDNGIHLLRTHTSNAQIHTMLKQTPPVAIASVGRVFRNEATDASHDFQFNQWEALLIDTDVSIAHLIYIIRHVLRSFFQHDKLEIRVRPGYFPFVEPGLEVDASCLFCKDGCSVCKKTKWIELGGAGLVHPHVLKSCNIDTQLFNGCALGFGLERIALLKYGINDVRMFHSSKIEFLSQYNRLIF